ncbi:X-linked retinitis pigmentosa GTPase regulator-like isoform X2 [Odontomachus brunneus]|uniref:X-linked retinitis pigmentosa GTPase regulator-like isoform X2 n=1 Tax=Odontomachus brunneus TaxID=486640 RepID=UPI0013F22AE3|nr:X-linked retinitis pigmentosa GTPase regulator-like isoform X2 [Odontomachus brunneus]
MTQETGAVFTIGRSRFADNIASHFFIRKDPVVIITCGDEHSAVVCQTGRLFVFGSNDWGQLGLGHKNHISKPSCVKILKPEKVTHVACGRAHTLICTGAQKIFACGSNQEGQLGRESSAIGDSSSSPILIYDCGLAGPRILQVAAGSHHSMALTSDGGVIAWGSNLEGQLGLPGISGLVNKPTKVPIPEPVKEISAGYYHSAFLTESGLVYVCGESESGKLGIDVNFSTQVAPKQMQLPAPALHVTCGGHHTLVLAGNGNIYCSGSNASGQLGMGTNVNEVHTPKLLSRGALQDETIVKIACGESHSAILTESGKLFTCGDGRHGKLGLEENENNVHEVTFAAKYQELFVSNVSCGGCHTILVGRRHEMNYQLQQQSDTAQMEQSAQKISSLPPLKLPVNMQNEQRLDNMENKSTNGKDNDADKNSEKLQNNDAETNSSENAATNNSNLVNGSSRKDEDNVSHQESSKAVPSETIEESQPADHEDQAKDEENEQDDKNNESQENNKESDKSQESNENAENQATQETEESHTEVAETTATNEIEQETSTNTTPPPKPPRLKSGDAENMSNEKESSKGSDEAEEIGKEENGEETKASDERIGSTKSSDGRTKSAISKTGDENTADVTENSIDKVEKDGHVEESGKAEVDGAQDDADVVQSPAPRTGKMAKLFKAKRQQEIQNGTKSSSSVANPKAKSKTCTIL